MADLQNQPQELFPQPFSGRTPDDESVCHMRCSTEHLLPETRSWHAPSSIDVAATEHSAAAGGVGQR
ncbi:hypothetical protein [Streptomyces sp. NPDC101455]|uniref:hypothetical protein n=1 Tax=Streptomyces sp. NPDC101455 TaxID=3366142 RepID=UPI0038139E85